jgi:hypothetical protein
MSKSMMRVVLLGLIALAVLVPGCARAGVLVAGEGYEILGQGAPPDGGSEAPLAFALREDAPASEIPAGLPEGAREALGAALAEGGTGLLVVISLGEKPSTGYRVAVESLELGEGGAGLVVTYRVEAPDPQAGGAPALTYPYIVLRVPGVDISPANVAFRAR